jgi:hypothetical protein
MRFVSEPRPDKGLFSAQAVRCSLCCEGNQVNTLKEMEAIRAYLAGKDPTGEWAWREERAEAEVRAAEDSRLQAREVRRLRRELRLRSLLPGVRPPLRENGENGN